MVKAIWKPGGADIEDARAVRRAVFIDELGYDAQEDIDRADDIAWHLVVYSDDGEAVGCARLFPVEIGVYSLGRIAVKKDFRGAGYGDLLMRVLLFKSQELGAQTVRVGAREDAAGFYEKYGFSATGEKYVEQGVGHVVLEIAAADICLAGSCGGDCANCAKAGDA